MSLKFKGQDVTQIRITAKCSDLFNAQLMGKEGKRTKELAEYSGYVPDFFPGDHCGDYVMLDIDPNTGQILNWKKLKDRDLTIFKPGADA